MQISYSTELSMEAKQSEGIDNVYPLKAIQFFSPPHLQLIFLWLAVFHQNAKVSEIDECSDDNGVLQLSLGARSNKWMV